MPEEERTLRDLFAESDAPTHRIDAARVIAASRRRRLPRQLAAGGIGLLAIVGIGVLSVQTLQAGSPTSTVSLEQDQSAPESSTRSDSSAGGSGSLFACIAPTRGNADGLVAQAEFPEAAPASDTEVSGMVSFANTTTESVTVTVPRAILTLSRGGATVWTGDSLDGSTPLPTIVKAGETIEVPAAVATVACSDGAALTPGEYEIVASIPVITAAGELMFVSSRPVGIRLD
jgi:hypothetical protein